MWMVTDSAPGFAGLLFFRPLRVSAVIGWLELLTEEIRFRSPDLRMKRFDMTSVPPEMMMERSRFSSV